MHMAYGLGIFVCLLFVTSVVTAVTLEPPRSSGYGVSQPLIALASAERIGPLGAGN
jgi:hypothetical protein